MLPEVLLAPAAPDQASPLVLSHTAPRDNAVKFAQAVCLTNGALATWHWDEQFWRWNGCFYECIGDKQIEDEIWKFLDGAKLHDSARFVPRPFHVSELKTALKSAISIDPKTSPPAWIGENPPEVDPRNLLVFRNAMLDVETGAVRRLHPGLWTHDGAGYGYNAGAIAPRWEEFLNQIFNDQQSRDTLEEVLGYCMTYDTKFDKGFVLCGVKRSGKSTVMDVLEKLIGSKSYIGVSFSTLRNENSFQDVIDKRSSRFPTRGSNRSELSIRAAILAALIRTWRSFCLTSPGGIPSPSGGNTKAVGKGGFPQRSSSRLTRPQTCLTPLACCQQGSSRSASTIAFTTVKMCIFGESLKTSCPELPRDAYRRCDG
jgi:hypothetical protein